MEENFLIQVKKTFTLEQSQHIIGIVNKLKCINIQHNVYNYNFAIGLANDIIANKLDNKSVVAGLYYPLIKNDLINQEMLNDEDDEVYNMLMSLTNIEKLNISTKQEQLDSIKNMFIAIAKDIRVIIIKLCVELQN